MLRMYFRVSEYLGRMAGDASGATGIEYAFVVAGIAVIGVTAADLIGGEITTVFDSFTRHLSPSTAVVVVVE